MIVKQPFGITGHESTRIIFGGYALSNVTQQEANIILKLLLKFGINHIDTAPMYGDSEKRIGPWMEQHRNDFFLATKTRKRTKEGAWDDLQRSLEKMKVDYIDLWQLHGLTNPSGWDKVMGSGGALEAFIEARDKGLVKFLGVTGHGNHVPRMHKKSLERFNFDSVLLPYNYLLMQNSRYSESFNELVELCQKQSIAIQTIKSVSRKPWGKRSRTHNTYFYEPLQDQDAIDIAVHWALGFTDSFLITAGDMTILPMMLDAANRYKARPADSEMNEFVDKYGIREAAFSMSDLK
ncbi:MAG: aldo/keto reductase [Candidatus Thorarchaeota archaeon]|jgi:aryl-alcohol dehydrogenase-like predicted oxidoreductase